VKNTICNISKKKPIVMALSALMGAHIGAINAQDSDSDIEEVVVTGSFIRRTEGFRSSSPVTQISSDDIAAFGTSNIGDVISALSFNNGTPTTANILGSTPTVATTQSFNLRGLGARATLNLVDGLRVVNGNVNTFLPQIALQRLDIVTDGAAALYGTAAVAGVVNFVPLKSYDGVKVEVFGQGDARGDYEDFQFSMLAGGEFAGFDIVGALEVRNNGNLGFLDRPDQFDGGITFSSTGNPGTYNVPVRDENGMLTGDTSRTPDPGCGTREDQTVRGSNPAGFVFGGRCRFEFGEFHDYRTKQDTANAFTNISYDVSDTLSLSFQGSLYEREDFIRRSPSSSGGNTGALPAVIRGELPGNPYRAVDANGNPLFARDTDGDGIPDRNSENQVILDPNGIPFNEDVTFNAWRPFTKYGTLPSNLNGDGSRRGGGKTTGYRTVFTADYSVPFLSGWEGRSAYTHQKSKDEDYDSNYRTSAIAAGLNCDVTGPREDCFNPFYTDDPALMNSQALVDRIAVQQKDRDIDRLQTFDTFISGTVEPGGFQLPGGSIGAAVGYQWRRTENEYTPTQLAAEDDRFNGAQQFPSAFSREVNSIFMELSLPVLEMLELQYAVRKEEYTSGQDSTDPKYGVIFTPFNNLSLRASAGTSFVAPTPGQLNAPESCGLQPIDDPFSDFTSFAQTCNTGNPDLVPESADTLSVGFTWDIIPDLRLDMSWSETDFKDRIVATGLSDVLANDFANYIKAYGTPSTPNGEPTLDQLATWLADPRSDKRIVRNANDLGFVERVFVSSSNASSELVRAVDMQLTYMFGFQSVGDFRLNANATYIDTHEVQFQASEEPFEATGAQNDFTRIVPPIPRWKANVGLGWIRGNHAARMTARFTDTVTYDSLNLPSSWRSVLPNLVTGIEEIDQMTTVDLSYTYNNIDVLGGNGEVTLGSRNLFDVYPDRLGNLGGNEAFLYDPTGRMIYARLSYEF